MAPTPYHYRFYTRFEGETLNSQDQPKSSSSGDTKLPGIHPSFGRRGTPFTDRYWMFAALTGQNIQEDGKHYKKTIDINVHLHTFDESWNKYKARLFHYDIFAPSLMEGFIFSSTDEIEKDAIIGQRVFLGLVALEMAVKVIDVFDEDEATSRKSGFTYQTLKGHPEEGCATFSIEQNLKSGQITFTIASISKLGLPFGNLFGWIALGIQKRSIEQAFKHFSRI